MTEGMEEAAAARKQKDKSEARLRNWLHMAALK